MEEELEDCIVSAMCVAYTMQWTEVAGGYSRCKHMLLFILTQLGSTRWGFPVDNIVYKQRPDLYYAEICSVGTNQNFPKQALINFHSWIKYILAYKIVSKG